MSTSNEQALKDIDRAFATQGLGDISASTGNLFQGFNHRAGGHIAPSNLDSQGYVFFTKPDMNLSYDNVAAVRRLEYLGDQDTHSMGAAVRCLLSPHVKDNWGFTASIDDIDFFGTKRTARSEFVDDRSAFITPLSSLLVTLSGWPDIVVDAYTSDPGLRGEVVGWADGIVDYYGSFELTANFRNIDGDPITAIFQAWTEYTSRVATGHMDPYPSKIAENEIDYQSRIYRIVLDPTRTFVRKIVDACAVWPNAAQLNLDYNSESNFVESDEQISIRLNAIGARYNDPRTIYNFNRTVQTFNSAMRDGVRESKMRKLRVAERNLFAFLPSYPRINDHTFELEWWVTNETYQLRNSLYNSNAQMVTP